MPDVPISIFLKGQGRSSVDDFEHVMSFNCREPCMKAMVDFSDCNYGDKLGF